MADRNPVPLLVKLTIRNVKKYKKISCAFYESCLNSAADDNWPQFHCRECNAYEIGADFLNAVDDAIDEDYLGIDALDDDYEIDED